MDFSEIARKITEGDGWLWSDENYDGEVFTTVNEEDLFEILVKALRQAYQEGFADGQEATQ